MWRRVRSACVARVLVPGLTEVDDGRAARVQHQRLLHQHLGGVEMAGDVTATRSGDRIEFNSVAADIARITVRDGVAGGLGFSAEAKSPTRVSLEASGLPDEVVLSADLNFTLDLATVGGVVVPLNLLLGAAATEDNLDAADLAVLFEHANRPSLLHEQVRRRESGGAAADDDRLGG